MKQAILVRGDLKLPKGKLSVQCCHASVDCVLRSNKHKISKWRDEGMPKIVLKVKDLRELKTYLLKAKASSLTTALIKDAGKTYFKSPTITCLGIGPDSDDKINKIIKELKLI